MKLDKLLQKFFLYLGIPFYGYEKYLIILKIRLLSF